MDAMQRCQDGRKKTLPRQDEERVGTTRPEVRKKSKKCKSHSRHTKTSSKKSKSKKKAKTKKSKRKHKKESDNSSSSEDESDSTDCDSSDSSSSFSSSSSSHHKRRKRHKKSKAHKRDEDADIWVEKCEPLKTSLQRDGWMTSSDGVSLQTFSKERKEVPKPNEKCMQIDAYDPSKSSRELNPYWQRNGTGLPSFQKPRDDELEHLVSGSQNDSRTSKANTQRGWQKSTSSATATISRQRTSSSSSSSDPADCPEKRLRRSDPESANISSKDEQKEVPLTDQQRNQLSSQMLRAELKGDVHMVNKLKNRLDMDLKLAADASIKGAQRAKEEKHVLLTRTDARGNVCPLLQSRSLGSARDDAQVPKDGKRTKKNQRLETHEQGQRVRYFGDDDRYDIKQMFEREKFATAAESNLEYAKLVSKHKNPNDDLEDIFADNARKNVSQEEMDRREMKRAVVEQERQLKLRQACKLCHGPQLQKNLVITEGKQIYLSLPWHMGIKKHYCQLTTKYHVPAARLLDEDVWEELTDFRKALVRMFAQLNQMVVFCEVARRVDGHRHFAVECIPLPMECEEVFFHFKKAIEDSEEEWSVNKQLLKIKGNSMPSVIPKGLPYVWVHFGMEWGYAHVIEDAGRFSDKFGLETIAGMLQQDPGRWRRPPMLHEPEAKVKEFVKIWSNFDCTKS